MDLPVSRSSAEPEPPRAKAVLRFLRGLHGLDRQPPTVRELERESRALVRRGLEGLFEHYVAAAIPAELLGRPRPRAAFATIWRSLHAAGVPLPEELFRAPGEAPAASARALDALLAGRGERAGARVRRRAWLLLLDEGQAAALERFRALAVDERAVQAAGASRSRAVCVVAALLLDLGRPQEAARWLEERTDAVALRCTATSEVDGDPALLLAAAWLATGRVERARELLAVAALRRAPGAVRELALAFEGAGDVVATAPHSAPSATAALPRAQAGAALDVLFRFHAGANGVESRPVRTHVAPGRVAEQRLRAAEAWLATRSRTSDADLRFAPALRIDRRFGEEPLADVSRPRDVRARVAVPVEEVDGTVPGFVLLEFEHALVPARPALAALAVSARDELRAMRFAGRRPRAFGLTTCEVAPFDPRRRVAEALLDVGLASARGLGVRVLDRLVNADGTEHWTVVAVRGEERGSKAEPADERRRASQARGPAPHDDGESAPAPERGLALTRAAASGAVVAFESAGDQRPAGTSGAGRGVVLPLGEADGDPARLLGLVEVEGEGACAARDGLATVLADGLPAYRAARFRAWHRSRFEREVVVARGSVLEQLGRELECAAHGPRGVLLSGPRGAGRTTLARWIHFARFAAAANEVPWVELSAGAAETCTRLDELRDAGATVCLRDLEELTPPVAAALRTAPRLRLVATSTRRLNELALPSALAERFLGLGLRVPSLAERRGEIPALARACARHPPSSGAGEPRAEFSDDALALLWRQDWRGNVGELRAFLEAFFVFRAGRGDVQADELVRTARCGGLALRERIPPRDATEVDVEAALASTKKRNGRPNKTRAALYLGWDPDTLRAWLKRRTPPAQGAEARLF